MSLVSLAGEHGHCLPYCWFPLSLCSITFLFLMSSVLFFYILPSPPLLFSSFHTPSIGDLVHHSICVLMMSTFIYSSFSLSHRLRSLVFTCLYHISTLIIKFQTFFPSHLAYPQSAILENGTTVNSVVQLQKPHSHR